jgi:uncharacterized protein YggU (UPF0235/DUF167 family)
MNLNYIEVKVITGSSLKKIIWMEDLKIFKVYLNSNREKGKANKELIETIANYFNISKSKVSIVSGFATTRKKILIIA